MFPPLLFKSGPPVEPLPPVIVELFVTVMLTAPNSTPSSPGLPVASAACTAPLPPVTGALIVVLATGVRPSAALADVMENAAIRLASTARRMGRPPVRSHELRAPRESDTKPHNLRDSGVAFVLGAPRPRSWGIATSTGRGACVTSRKHRE